MDTQEKQGWFGMQQLCCEDPAVLGGAELLTVV